MVPYHCSYILNKGVTHGVKEFSYEKALLFFAKSKYADLFGVALVIAIAIASGYLSTNLAKYVDWYDHALHSPRRDFRD